MSDKQIEERNDKFDSAVREQFAGHEPQVPHALWNRISSELDRGEASEGWLPMADHHERSVRGRWRLAIAAAVILTLTVGTLLYTLNPTHSSDTPSGTIANKSTTVSQPATAPVQVMETRTVAEAAPVSKKAVQVMHRAVSPRVNPVPETTTAANTTAPVETAPAEQNPAPDAQLAAAPVQTENKPVEVGNIPLASLNFLSTPSSLNDEITVIKSNSKKKKHGKNMDEPTRVIVIGKKFDTKPDINYQVPVRF